MTEFDSQFKNRHKEKMIEFDLKFKIGTEVEQTIQVLRNIKVLEQIANGLLTIAAQNWDADDFETIIRQSVVNISKMTGTKINLNFFSTKLPILDDQEKWT